MLVLIALPNLIGGPGSDTVASVWEFTRRFADHVDWDLGRAQGQNAATSESSFRRREGVVWLRNAELAGGGGNTTLIAVESAAWGRTFVAALDAIRGTPEKKILIPADYDHVEPICATIPGQWFLGYTDAMS